MKIPQALCKHRIQFFGVLPFRKGKVCCYWIILYLCRVIKIKFYWFIASFLLFFLKDKKLKKLAAAFLLALFACKDPSPLYKSSKTRNHLKPENLETLFLLSALKMPIKSATSYQAETKYLEDAWLSFDFQILQPYIHISTFKYVLI